MAIEYDNDDDGNGVWWWWFRCWRYIKLSMDERMMMAGWFSNELADSSIRDNLTQFYILLLFYDNNIKMKKNCANIEAYIEMFNEKIKKCWWFEMVRLNFFIGFKWIIMKIFGLSIEIHLSLSKECWGSFKWAINVSFFQKHVFFVVAGKWT